MSLRKGGAQSRRAALLGTNERFRLYLDDRRRQAHDLSISQLPDGTHTEQDAIDWLRNTCGIKSRAELDHNAQARQMFVRIIEDHNRWRRRHQKG